MTTGGPTGPHTAAESYDARVHRAIKPCRTKSILRIATQRGQRPLLLLATIGLLVLSMTACGSGLPDQDEASLVRRVSVGLEEAGGSAIIVKCLTRDLDAQLTEKDADSIYSDLTSNPQASEKSLNSISLLPPRVRTALRGRVQPCKSELVASRAYSPARFDVSLRHLDAAAYGHNPNTLLRGGSTSAR